MHYISHEDIPYTSNSEALFEKLRDLPDAIWLDSAKPRSLQGRFDIISAYPDIIIETNGQHSTITDINGVTESRQDPFDLAKHYLGQLLPINSPMNAPFYSGLIGYFGYDLGRHNSGKERSTQAVTNLPDMRLGRYLWSLVINHEARKSTLFFHPLCATDTRDKVYQRLVENAEKPSLKSNNFELLENFSATLTQQQYKQSIRRIKEYIAAGDCYQINFTQHHSAPYRGDLWQAYLSLREACPAPYSVFWQWDDCALLSISPERFIQTSVEGGKIYVETKPIKGTVLRGTTVAEDQENAIQLVNSAKDRAENLMIVDLLRNDIGKSCIAGSIQVPKLFDLESFPNVHHLVSTISGVLRPDCTPIDLFKGCFPGGSITGAPKLRAMEIIEELEPVKRSAYCGAIGYFCASNQMDTNIAIRTLIADKSHLHCWGGGGIVADSDPMGEFNESMYKIHLILETLEKL
jgi:para-aminobenzoate synthetase component 1